MLVRILAAVLLASLSVGPTRAQEKLPVVATFSILGDLVKNVGGDRVAVATLVQPNGDVHVYQPSPADAKTVADAKVVFMNGVGLEGWLDSLVKASGGKGRVVIATKGIKTLEMKDDDGHGHAHERLDPHAWQSVANAKIYVVNIRDALVAADPSGREVYEKNAADYLQRLSAVEREIKQTVAKIPPARRRVITSHDAFGYFASAYGIEFIAPQGVSTESEASARDVAKIIREIRARKIPAVFLENISDPRLMQQIVRETGAKIGGTVYSDSLSGADGPAASYIAMMEHNIRQFAAALAD
jgi:zinc/manganese transport system substrate-binding protein